MPTSPLFVILSLLVAPSPRAAAHDITWTNVGPGGGGWLQSIACDPRDPGVIYLGCDVGGVYTSRDAGHSWRIQNTGLNDYFVECIAVHPQDSDIIVLGMEGGIFKTTDQGETWKWKREGFPEARRYSFAAPIGALCFDPTRPNVLYAGIGRPRRHREGKGHMYKSEDCGETWRLITPEGMLAPEAIVSDLEVSPDGEYIIAATSEGIYRSEDQGATWQACNEGLPHTYTRELAIAPADPLVVYCTVLTTARDDEPWNGGVCRSDDGGKTWEWRSEGLEKHVAKRGKPAPLNSIYREIVVDPRDPDTVYVGGESWVSAGMFKSTDGGESWSRSSWHFSDKVNMDRGWITQWGPSVKCLSISPANPDRLVFGSSGQVYLTDDGGAAWDQRYCRQFDDGRFAGTGLEVTCFNDVVPDPFDENRVYFCYFDIGLLISDDRGKTFRKGNAGMEFKGNCFTVAFDPAARNKLWAGTGQWGSNQGDVCKSEDRGRTWTVVGKPDTGLPNGQTKCLLVNPDSPAGSRTLYVTCNGHGIYKSEDDGASWRAINEGLPEAAAKRPCGIIMDPEDSEHLRVALGGNPPNGSGIYETRDGGETWARVGQASRLSELAPFADLKDFRADPNDFDTLYICQREKYDRSLDPPVQFPGGLFKSADGGKTWQRIYEFHFTNCIAISPQDGNTLYIGTTDHPYHDANWAEGVLKSTDGGETWRQEVEGLTCWNIGCIRVDPHDPSRIYIGTGGNGGFIGVDGVRFLNGKGVAADKRR